MSSRQALNGRQRAKRLRAVLAVAIVGMLVLGAAACAPAAPPRPAAAPAAGPVAARPAESSAPKAAWEVEWEQVVVAARQEGKVALSGPPSQGWRTALLTFEQDYPGIQLEYTGANSRDYYPRLFQERRAGQYLWDLRVGGPDTQVFQARDEGMLEFVPPLLLLPEVVDESKWLGVAEGLLYADRDGRFVRNFLAQSSSVAHVNRDALPEPALRSLEELLDPRWKGRMAIQDPRGGAGLAALTVLLHGYGEGFVRSLLAEQGLVVTNDNRQGAEWVVRGRYPIGVGISTEEFTYFEEQGLKANIKTVPQGAKGLAAGFGAIQVFTQAPHPNATKVFVNWLLTQRAQGEIARAVKHNSMRLDVLAGDPS